MVSRNMIQGSIIKELRTKLYDAMINEEVPYLDSDTKKSKSFKKYLKEHPQVKLKENSIDIRKLTRIVRMHNLNSSFHITGMRYVRIATYLNVEELLNSIINCGSEYYELPNGNKVRATSLRYHTFANDLTCVSCGIKGQLLALERCLGDKGGDEGPEEGQGFHLNLYGLDEMGREILMTKDHIYPKSKGGPDTLENLQTMCTYCNSKKGDTITDDLEDIKAA